ncbi:MAG: phosphotransferase [Acinetobacter populi]|jgi:Ser/Thr protein kinase RdoA (MazF antagonist)|uniref:phosphotransferase enzyme family protein n=1 Tax=Acinetobacter populi TaxID=1582270 RepID=UPI0023577D7D|nr:phosphotransferase [Acinetobacter populi]MCH4249094.1 phosphotransferase [Acinetobacter populi]
MPELNDHCGHGMGTDLEPKDWVNISAEDLKRIQPYYPVLQGEMDIIWHSPRPFSSASIIRSAQGEFLLKRSHHSFRSVADLQQEHHFIAHLARKGVAVPQIFSNAQGQTATALDDWIYELHEKVAGEDIYADQQSWKSFFVAQHALQAGKALAHLHVAAVDFLPDQSRTTQYLISNQKIIESPSILQDFADRIQQSPALSEYFEKCPVSDDFLALLLRLQQPLLAQFPKFKKIWTHNDLHASNLLWRNGSDQAEVAAVIDFGLTDLTSIPYDIAVAIERNFIDWLALDQGNDLHIDVEGLCAFIRGYAQTGENLAQLDFVPDILPLAHIDFALYELEYFVGITRNETHAKAAYAYLIEHTYWFVSAQGQDFLAQLKRIIHARGEHV